MTPFPRVDRLNGFQTGLKKMHFFGSPITEKPKKKAKKNFFRLFFTISI
jgi:hypothetical protein